MIDRLFELQMQYARACFHAERYAREAQIAKDLLDKAAAEMAQSAFDDHRQEMVQKPIEPAAEAEASTLRLRLMIGAYSRVARQTATDRGHVLRVVKGERKSDRVQAAWNKEMVRIEREVAKRYDPRGERA